jgi:hypothetical protein
MASIATLKGLDAGTKGLATEGKVVYRQPRKHLQGTSEKTGKDYDFYSQFTVVEDVNGDSIVIDLGDSREVAKGDFIRVHKGLLKDHTDINDTQAPQSTSQMPQNRPQSTTQPPQGSTNTEDRRCAWESACRVAASSTDMDTDDIESLAIAGAYFIATGKAKPVDQGGQPNPGYVGDNPAPPQDGDPIPF